MKTPALDVQGQGDTAVLLLHGIGGGRSIWGDAASGTASAIAAAGYRAVAIDLPGYGDSATMGAPTMDSFVGGVLAVIEAVAARRVVLLGHSMGGMVAQEFVFHAPSFVQGLILACTSSAFGKPGGEWQARFVGERLAPLDAGLGMAGVARQLVPGMVAPTSPPLSLQTSMDIMARVPEPTYRAALQVVANFDRREALAAIAVPTLMLAGENDRTAPPEVMQRMAGRVPGAEYLCLPQTGHIANVETPAAFNAAVVDFLRRHFGGA